jgi:hypothetical protein
MTGGMNLALDFPHYYDTGHAPSVAISSQGLVVETHQGKNDTNLYSYVGMLTGTVWTILGGDKAPDNDQGTQPSIAVNKDRVVVRVSHEREQNGGHLLNYSVGRVKCPVAASGTIDWHQTPATYDNGHDPVVALNDAGIAVEVHRGKDNNHLWYHVGKLSADHKLTWSSSVSLADGRSPAVAINAGGVVAAVFNGASGNALYCFLGQADPSGARIDTLAAAIALPGDGQYPSVALTDDGYIVVTQSSPAKTRTGRINGATIEWRDEAAQFGAVGAYRVAISGRDAIAVAEAGGANIYYAASTLMARADWMQENFNHYMWRGLNEVVLPGSHDSGMATCEGCTLGMVDKIGMTQYANIGEQLRLGARFFDMRPTWLAGTIKLGHFDSGTSLGSWGQLLFSDNPSGDSALKQVTDFLKVHREIVFLRFSHCYVDQNVGASDLINLITKGKSLKSMPGFNDEQMDTLLKGVHDALKDYLDPYLGSFLNGISMEHLQDSERRIPRATVIPIFEKLSDAQKKKYPGLYSYRDFGDAAQADLHIYDDYANKSDAQQMIEDQRKKFVDASHHGGNMYLLSWTATMGMETLVQGIIAKAKEKWDQVDSLGGFVNFMKHIDELFPATLDYVKPANEKLASGIMDWYANGLINPETFPNVLSIDAFTGSATDLCLWISRHRRVSDTLAEGDYLSPGDRVYSSGKPQGGYYAYLAYQTDGNLVIYDSGNRPKWNSGTVGKRAWRAVIEPGANLVIYSEPGNKIWETGSCGSGGLTIGVGPESFRLGRRQFDQYHPMG